MSALSRLWMTLTGNPVAMDHDRRSIASVTVPAGMWTISGAVTSDVDPTTQIFDMRGGIGTDDEAQNVGGAAAPQVSIGDAAGFPIDGAAFQFDVPTVVYLLAKAAFSGGRLTATGVISAVELSQ